MYTLGGLRLRRAGRAGGPTGRACCFGTTPPGSASIAADGLDLDSLELSDLKLRPLATTLVYQDWVAWSPDGRTVAVVAGGDREIWYSGKHVELCAIPAATCHGAVPLPARDVMSLDPAWSATAVVPVRPGAGRRPGPGSGRKATGPTTSSGGLGPLRPVEQPKRGRMVRAQRLFSAGPTGTGAHVLAARAPALTTLLPPPTACCTCRTATCATSPTGPAAP